MEIKGIAFASLHVYVAKYITTTQHLFSGKKYLHKTDLLTCLTTLKKSLDH